jgi:hypothetical protein
MSIPDGGPYVVLIGGSMTVDDGTSLDSRQKIEGDEISETIARSLATSSLWWHTAISVVMPILEDAGEEAFALVIGQRSVLDLRQDGTTKRTSLRSILPGGVGRCEILRTEMGQPVPADYEEVEVLRNWENDHMGAIGVKRGDGRWRYLQGNAYYLTRAAKTLAPAVVIDTSPWSLPDGFHAANFNMVESTRLFSPDVVLVAPHTYGTERYLRTYAEWIGRGRPPDPPLESYPENNWDPNARPDPVHYATPVPIAATFGITGFMVATEWQDPGDLEAARGLLEARYDLKIGIWDLASNPTLRKTLLRSAPVVPAPPIAVPVPRAAGLRAEARVDAKMRQREAERRAVASATERLGALKALGWARRADKQRGVLQLPLTEPMGRDIDDEPFPLVLLALDIAKRHTEVLAFTIMYNQVDLGAYLESRRPVFTDIAGPAECKLGSGWSSLWHVSGGWGDDVDWEARALLLASLTPRWIEALAEQVEECLKVRRASGHLTP